MPAAANAHELAAEALRLVGIDVSLARARANEALLAARRTRDKAAESLALRARGLAALESERMAEAEADLRAAIRVAAKVGAQQVAEARMSLALVLMARGRGGPARRAAQLAVDALAGQEQARARVQLALIEQRSGAHPKALASYEAAVGALRACGDQLWEARALNNRGLLLAYRGDTARAERDLQRAESLCQQLGQHVTAADIRWNLGFVAGLSGDGVLALQRFDEAGPVLDAAGVNRGSSFLDRCHVLLSVGLITDARTAIEDGIRQLSSREVEADLAEAYLLLTQTLLALGLRAEAADVARRAEALLDGQGRRTLAVLARFELLRATELDPVAEVWSRAEQVEAELRLAGWQSQAAAVALMRVGRTYRAGETVAPEQALIALRATRSTLATDQIAGWYAVALARLSRDDSPGAVRALVAGLRVHDRQRATLATTELQVHAGRRATDLAELGLRLAVAGGKAPRVLAWAERWRAGSLLARPVRPPKDTMLAARLADLRAAYVEADLDRVAGGGSALAGRRVALLERQVTDRARLVATEFEDVTVAIDASLFEALGARCLIEFVVVDGDLWAVVAVDGRLTMQQLASVADVNTELEALRYAFTRAARGGTERAQVAAEQSLAAAARRLDGLILAPLAPGLGERPLVVVPTGMLHVLPWPLLATAESREVTVAPSAQVWLAATRRKPQNTDRIAVVAGPGLPGAEQEVEIVAKVYGDRARVLLPAEASSRAVLEALSGVSSAHIAAHGTFRAENPLFSALHLIDGPLTVYDLESLGAAPELVVLSACDSGLSQVSPGDELMGLTAAFLRAGTRTLLASVAPVPDLVARDTMYGFHQGLAAGLMPAAALLRARSALADPSARSRAAAFVCFGAG